MHITALRALALAHGILILDYEDPTTIRAAVAEAAGLDGEAAVTDAQVRAVTEAMFAAQDDLVLLSETAEGGAALRAAVRAGMRVAGVAVADGGDGAEDDDGFGYDALLNHAVSNHDTDILDAVYGRASTPVPAGTCVGCGCTHDRACPGGCAWLAHDPATRAGVCSSCAPSPAAAAAILRANAAAPPTTPGAARAA